jgi:citrate synthase
MRAEIETASAKRTPLLPALEEQLATRIACAREDVKKLLADYGDRAVSEVTLQQAYGGMRSVKCMVTETSSVDPYEGIRFRGYTIPELRERLPKAPGGEEPLPEGVFHLLLTGDLPTVAEVTRIREVWRDHETLPPYVTEALGRLPVDTHPMTQYSLGILAMQRESIFARAYREGLPKQDQWRAMLDDALQLLARLPLLAAHVYRRTYHAGRHVAPAPRNLDWAGNLAHMMGVEHDRFRELMRLYLSIHADHEGGNVSAHTTHLVGSALSDAYLALSAGMNGLAGPLHGLANQEVVRWILTLKERIGSAPTRQQVRDYVWHTLETGQVVPGYGHAVLRRTDPRYTAQREFAMKHLPDDENFAIVRLLYEVVPEVLQEQGKAKNPWPNVDAHSGCLLLHYGVDEYDFYTVLFGVSRAMGVMASLVWDRALMLPLERPKSVTTEWIRREIAQGRLG